MLYVTDIIFLYNFAVVIGTSYRMGRSINNMTRIDGQVVLYTS